MNACEAQRTQIRERLEDFGPPPRADLSWPRIPGPYTPVYKPGNLSPSALSKLLSNLTGDRGINQNDANLQGQM